MLFRVAIYCISAGLVLQHSGCQGSTSSGKTCTPVACSAQGKNCGNMSDGCGGTLDCGSSCPAGQSCGGGGQPNVCGTSSGTSSATSIISPERRTSWNPGIPGGIPAVNTIHTIISAATYGSGTADATGALNSAIRAAGEAAARSSTRQVVYLPAGTYRTTGPILLDRSNVVLRGAGAALTRIVLDTTDEVPAVRIGIFWPDYHEGGVNVVNGVPKGATSIKVENGNGFQVGDVIQIDQLDDTSYVLLGDGTFFKRGPSGSPPSPAGYRSVGQQLEVASKSGNVLGLSGPTHVAFSPAFDAEVFKTATVRSGEWGTRYVGLEELYVTGGNNDNITLLNTAYCWVKNVESDGDPAGIGRRGTVGHHISLDRAYRCEVRGSYVHHARYINPGGGAYGITLRSQSSDNLVEDNVVYKLNKPIVMIASGGGNVVAYNYADEGIIAYRPDWQENTIDAGHTSFPHHELFEGNWTPNIGCDTTHGNSGWMTFFRNYAPGKNSSGAPWNDIRAVGVTGWSRYYNIVGNVLLQPNLANQGHAPIYESTSTSGNLDAAAVYRIGNSADPVAGYGSWDDGTALRQLYRHGNYDYVTNSVVWDSQNPDHSLPSSLYLTGKPAFFGSMAWPWVDPVGPTKVATLPAKARFDAGVLTAPPRPGS
jgi:hypothetical protein